MADGGGGGDVRGDAGSMVERWAGADAAAAATDSDTDVCSAPEAATDSAGTT